MPSASFGLSFGFGRVANIAQENVLVDFQTDAHGLELHCQSFRRIRASLPESPSASATVAVPDQAADWLSAWISPTRSRISHTLFHHRQFQVEKASHLLASNQLLEQVRTVFLKHVLHHRVVSELSKGATLACMGSIYTDALQCAIEAARRAGQHLLEESRRPGGPRGWGSHAEADVEAESLIHAKLNKFFPDWGYLGEELGMMREPNEHLWLIDPNDATTAFLQGLRGPSVSIGLLRDLRPVLGVVFAYTAPDEAGDLIAWAEGCGPLQRNGHTVTRSWPAQPDASCSAIVSVKRSRTDLERSAKLAHPIQVREYPSIAYRLALVAAGEADMAISTTGLKSWDIAAGHAMLLGTGGILCGGGGTPIEYAPDGSSDTKGRVLGGAHALVSHVEARLRQTPTTPWGQHN